MSEWKPFTLPMIPGAPEAMDAAGTAAGALSGVLDVLAGLLETLAGLVSMASDPLSAAIASLIQVIQKLVDLITGLLNSGIYFYLDKGPYLVGGDPDGLQGFLTRWEASFEDLGDKYRPQFAAGEPVSAMLFLVGGDDITELRPALAALGRLFNVPALDLEETEETVIDYPASIEQGLSTPPDWASVKLADALPPFDKLGQTLQRVVGMLAVGESYASMLENLAQVISDKAAALDGIATEIQAVVSDIDSLITAEGLYVLLVEDDGAAGVIDAVRSAAQAPPWSAEAHVAGVCLLGGTADFGPVVELLGG